jgi:hypothetical protein
VALAAGSSTIQNKCDQQIVFPVGSCGDAPFQMRFDPRRPVSLEICNHTSYTRTHEKNQSAIVCDDDGSVRNDVSPVKQMR